MNTGSGAAAALELAGARYWTASVLPALVGTVLPLWLRPRGFAFRPAGALEFLLATILMHSGFSLLQAVFERRTVRGRIERKLLGSAMACIALACVLGFHLLRFVPDLILIVFGASVILAGLLYVAPPASLCRRPGGEIVVSMSLALLPVLGAYLVQTEDLTRTVYLAALPIYAAMLLWVWTEQMAASPIAHGSRHETLITVFGPLLSGRVVVPAIAALLFLALLVAVLSSSVMPLALLALLLLVPVGRIVALSWNAHDDAREMLRARSWALSVHLWLCCILIVSSLWAVID